MQSFRMTFFRGLSLLLAPLALTAATFEGQIDMKMTEGR